MYVYDAKKSPPGVTGGSHHRQPLIGEALGLLGILRYWGDREFGMQLLEGF